MARFVAGDLDGEVIEHRVAVAAGGYAQHDGQAVQQPAADLAAYRVGADDQGRCAVPRPVLAGFVPAEPVAGAALLGVAHSALQTRGSTVVAGSSTKVKVAGPRTTTVSWGPSRSGG